MTYGELRTVIAEAGLTMEQAARRLGVSRMTLFRWRRRNAEDVIDPLYARAFEAAFLDLVLDGTLPATSSAGRAALAKPAPSVFAAAIRNLGLTEQDLRRGSGDTAGMTAMLGRVGARPAAQAEVDRNLTRVRRSARLGSDWRARIQRLVGVLASRTVEPADKFVAYGGLFYLLVPFDLIPDMLPGVGLLDDFALLGLAVVFYARRAAARKAK